MRVLLYLFLFVVILAVIVLGFFNFVTPDIPQTVVTRTLDPKEAFGAPPAPTPIPDASKAPATPLPTDQSTGHNE